MISVVVPAYNEEKALKNVIGKTQEVLKGLESEIIIVDDGSNDSTYEVAKKLECREILVLRHEKNKGKAAALETGYETARGKILVNIDADCTYPPEAIPKLVAPVESGEADLVLASRFAGKVDDMKTLNRLGNIFFSSLVSLLTGKNITDASTGMRAFSKSLWKNMRVEAQGLDWEVEMTTRTIRKGFRVVEVPIVYSNRVGESKLVPTRDGFAFLKAVVKGRFF